MQVKGTVFRSSKICVNVVQKDLWIYGFMKNSGGKEKMKFSLDGVKP